MSLENKGGIRLAKLTEASSFFTVDLQIIVRDDDRYNILNSSMGAFS